MHNLELLQNPESDVQTEIQSDDLGPRGAGMRIPDYSSKVQEAFSRDLLLFRHDLINSNAMEAIKRYPALRDAGVLESRDFSKLLHVLQKFCNVVQNPGYHQEILRAFDTVMSDVAKQKFLIHPYALVHAMNFCKINRMYEKGLSIWDCYKGRYPAGDTRAHGGALMLFSAAGKSLEECEEFYEKTSATVKKHKFAKETPGLISAMARVYTDHGEFGKAEAILQNLAGTNVDINVLRTYAKMINKFCEAGEIELALNVFERSCNAKSPPNYTSVIKLIKAMLKEDKIKSFDEVLRIFEQFKMAGGQDNASMSNFLVHCMFLFAKPEESEEVLKSAQELYRTTDHQINTVTFNTMLSGVQALKRYELIPALLKEMRQLRCHPTPPTFLILMKAYGEQGQAENVKSAWKQLNERAFPPDVNAWHQLYNSIRLLDVDFLHEQINKYKDYLTVETILSSGNDQEEHTGKKLPVEIIQYMQEHFGVGASSTQAVEESTRPATSSLATEPRSEEDGAASPPNESLQPSKSFDVGEDTEETTRDSGSGGVEAANGEKMDISDLAARLRSAVRDEDLPDPTVKSDGTAALPKQSEHHQPSERDFSPELKEMMKGLDRAWGKVK